MNIVVQGFCICEDGGNKNRKVGTPGPEALVQPIVQYMRSKVGKEKKNFERGGGWGCIPPEIILTRYQGTDQPLRRQRVVHWFRKKKFIAVVPMKSVFQKRKFKKLVTNTYYRSMTCIIFLRR